MIATLRLFACAGAIALAMFILELAQPGWVGQLATDLPGLPDLRSDLSEERELGQRLDEQVAALVARTATKQRFLKDLIDNRLTLVETARRFRDLDRSLRNGQPERLRLAWRGSSEAECYCHQIIRVAERELSEQPCAAAAVVVRLKAELEAAAESGVFCSSE